MKVGPLKQKLKINHKSTIDLETLETQLITSFTAKYLLWIRLLGFCLNWGFMGRFYGYKNAPTEKIQQTWCSRFLFLSKKHCKQQ